MHRINFFQRQNRIDNVCVCIHKKDNFTIPLHYMLPLMAVCCRSHTKWRKPSKSSQWNSVWSHWWKNSPKKTQETHVYLQILVYKQKNPSFHDKCIWYKKRFSWDRPWLLKRMRCNFWHFLQLWWGSSSFFTPTLTAGSSELVSRSKVIGGGKVCPSLKKRYGRNEIKQKINIWNCQ